MAGESGSRKRSRGAPDAPVTGWTERRPALETPAELHADYVRARVEGGGDPDTAAYARAREQWRRMSGAVTTSPADCGEVPPRDDPEPQR